MKHKTTTGLNGRTLLALFLSLFICACGGDGDKDEPKNNSKSESTSKETTTTTVDSRYLARSTAIRDGDSWRIHVTLPASFPDGATLKTAVIKTSSGSQTLTIDPKQGLLLDAKLGAETEDYEIILTDSQDRAYKTKRRVR